MIHVLIQTLGGLGLFVLGMKLMTEGLQMAAGNRIRNILKAVSDNRLVGFATGAAVTAMVQSSSATTVMLISFVSAGLMNLCLFFNHFFVIVFFETFLQIKTNGR